jgi:hypothetical protein
MGNQPGTQEPLFPVHLAGPYVSTSTPGGETGVGKTNGPPQDYEYLRVRILRTNGIRP